MKNRTQPVAGQSERPLLPELFARQAAATPRAVAVVRADGGTVTYAELASRAAAVARSLRALGTGPESPVGVCLPRGPGLVAALLGVWAAGGAYVPLDPAHPAGRLRGILTDAAVDRVLADRDTARLLPETGARVVLTGETGDGTASVGLPPGRPGGLLAGHAAYVLHTSGSTGRPKGVVVPHGGIANRVRWLVRRHGLGPGDRMLVKTTVGFDAAALEIFAPLVSGGSAVLAPDGAEHDADALCSAVIAHRVTILQGVPTVLRQITEAAGGRAAGTLRRVFSAGEQLHSDLCERLRAFAPDAEVWNTYGPTEASVDVTEQRYDPDQHSGPVPIGRPIGRTRALVLDAAGQPVPRGVPGELHVSGEGLARGYAGRPALTADRFVPDPFGDVYGEPGARLYRTGDRVRWRSDGALEYLGRLDDQLKVNGVRIEPAEIETALRGHPLVRDCAAGAVPGVRGARRTAAWIEYRGEARPAPEELRAFLRRVLPATHVPSVFVPVAALPRTTSGKIDRAALAALAPAPPVSSAPEGQGTAAQRAVAALWAPLLDLAGERIGPGDDFFQLGGSSLDLTRLAGGLSRLAGHPVPPRELFLATTVAAQAALAGRAAGPQAENPGRARRVPRTPAGSPLSPGQEGLWLLDRLAPGSAEWTAPVLVTLPAGYDDTTVRTALGRLADRHEILRTRYRAGADGPVQITDPPGARAPELRTVRIRAESELVVLAEREFSQGFDLRNGPVWRALAVRGPKDLVVLLSIHHIACDGWSTVILERELRVLAEAAHTGRTADLAPLPLGYADHAAHRRSVPEEETRGSLRYWREALAGAQPLDLPLDRPRPPVRDSGGAVRTFAVPADLVRAAEALGRSRGATLHQTLLTAFSALLGRLSGTWDHTIGIPVAGREDPGTEGIVGFFLNALVLRCDTSGDTPFTAALDRMRDTVRSAQAHQDVPFEHVVRELAPDRDLSRTPLYQIMFDLHEEGRTGTGMTGRELDVLRGAWRHARTDLTLVLHRCADGGLLGMAEYATALFDAETVERLTDCWLRLLEEVTADPGIRLDRADMLPPPLRARLLADGTDRASGAPEASAVPVHTAVEEVARRSPAATAVVCGDERWSYRTLDRRANAIAHRLRALGAGTGEDAVAVSLGRRPELIAAVLGVWKAGAVYVPLDPDAPPARRAHLFADSASRVLVTGPGGRREQVTAGWDGPVLDLTEDRDTDEPGRLSTAHREGPRDAAQDGPPPSDRDPSGSAYILYTSGSTGRPKGVAVPHRALAGTLQASRQHLDFGRGPDDAWLALARPTFDISFTELLMPLLTGGRVVLARESELGDHRAQLSLMERHAVTHLQVAPPHWQMLIDAGLGNRDVVGQTGGEPCPPALARALARRLRRFVNEYGLTETVIASTRWEAGDRATSVPIGRPYPHITARVLDDVLEPVPYGVLGELCVGGELARGYLGNPALTAQRFVPDPYGAPGARLYRTGDRARMRPDGTLEFAGRADGQVKIRGRRVETGEVAARLAEHPGVSAAVVTVHGAGTDAVLIGYCVPSGDALPATAELLGHCARMLPEHMLPAVFVPIDAVPLTRHNKVDTEALPAPDLASATTGAPWTAPEGPVQELIAEIWSEVLAGPDGRGPRVGSRQEFFRLGGDSVRAARVTARIEEEFEVRLPLRALFENPTVAGLAEAVESEVRAEIAALNETQLAAAQKEYQP